ncbi:aminodeoxychorismate lyase [Niallia sp.]|uniref:aminodeoxychorismate lyase n=1 Tax=Niallia sp. TaxID=2837523 RepID=UPI00289C90AC|nr:aminodeoxychorismate lyase [Niallia sp.]
MKPTIITSFAAGLLLATSVSGIVYFSTKDDSVKAGANTKVEKVETDVANTPTVEEMKEILTSSGYVVQTSEEAKQKEEDVEKQATESKASEEKTDTKEEEVKEEVKTVTVNVSSGMTSYDVGSILHDEKIIKETAMQFSLKVDKKGVAEYLKLGSFKIKSDMSTDEIISTIFKKPS